VHAESLLIARGIGRRFGALLAVRDVDLEIGAGEGVVIFGPNGAGKTTLARLLAACLKPTSGQLRIAGSDPWRSDRFARRAVGFLSHRTFLYDDLTARENLVFYARLYGLPRPASVAEQWLRDVGLASRAEDPVRTFSRGMQQRLAIARALLHDPPLAVLDEPFTGLDPDGSALLSRLLSDRRRAGRSFLLVTHDLAQGLLLADRWLLLARGRVVARGTAAETTAPRLGELYAELAGSGRGTAHVG
jgi:heme exporter protein A